MTLGSKNIAPLTLDSKLHSGPHARHAVMLQREMHEEVLTIQMSATLWRKRKKIDKNQSLKSIHCNMKQLELDGCPSPGCLQHFFRRYLFTAWASKEKTRHSEEPSAQTNDPQSFPSIRCNNSPLMATKRG